MFLNRLGPRENTRTFSEQQTHINLAGQIVLEGSEPLATIDAHSPV